jgi:hypothetical protein
MTVDATAADDGVLSKEVMLMAMLRLNQEATENGEERLWNLYCLTEPSRSDSAPSQRDTSDDRHAGSHGSRVRKGRETAAGKASNGKLMAGPASKTGGHSQLTGIVTNIRGYVQGRADLLAKISDYKEKPFIIAITETFLDSKTKDQLVKIDGYELYRKDRGNCRAGGGVLLFVRDDVKSFRRKELESDAYEYIAADIRTKQGLVTCIAVYRPPSADSSIFDYFAEKFENLPNNLLIVGDLNAWHKQLASPKENVHGRKCLEMCDWLGLECLNTAPTRIGNCLDLVLSSVIGGSSVTAPLGRSDHAVVNFFMQQTFKPKPAKTRNIYLWSKADWPRMRHYFKNLYFDSSASADDAANAVTNAIVHAQRRFVPRRVVKNKSIPEAWWTCRCARTRKLMEIAFVSSDRPSFLRARAHHLTVCKSAKRCYQRKLRACLNRGYCSRWWWQTAAKITGRIRSTTRQMPELSSLLKYYANKLSIDQSDDAKHVPQVPETEFPIRLLKRFVVTKKSVYKMLRNLKENKSSGSDDVSPRTLRNCSKELTTVITKLYRLIVNSASIPVKWKTTRISPIYKKGNHSEARNWRPVAVTSQLQLGLERVLLPQLKRSLDRHIPASQFGFVRKSSPSDHLALLSHHCVSSLNAKKEVIVASLDLDGAFDSMWWRGLLKVLEHLGIRNKAFGLIENYFTDRKIFVVADGECSETVPVTRGSPQGGIWSPLFFALFVRFLPPCVLASLILSFADDVVLVKMIESIERRKEAAAELSGDIQSLVTTAESWNMKFAPAKSSSVRISNKKDRDALKADTKLVVSNEVIADSDTVRILGVDYDNSFNFSPHVSKIASEGRQSIHLLKQLSQLLDDDGLCVAYKAYIRSKMEYACTAWMSASGLSKLDKIQQRCCKFFPMKLIAPLQRRRNAAALGLLVKVISNSGRPVLQAMRPTWNKPPPRFSRHYRKMSFKAVSSAGSLKCFDSAFVSSSVNLWNRLPCRERCEAFKAIRNGKVQEATKAIQRITA